MLWQYLAAQLEALRAQVAQATAQGDGRTAEVRRLEQVNMGGNTVSLFSPGLISREPN